VLLCLVLEICNSTSFHGQNIMESNPRAVTCGWKTFIQSLKQFNENRMIYGERERENTFTFGSRQIRTQVSCTCCAAGI
jgi:hypothetical protein